MPYLNDIDRYVNWEPLMGGLEIMLCESQRYYRVRVAEAYFNDKAQYLVLVFSSVAHWNELERYCFPSRIVSPYSQWKKKYV
jgi:hypothetical protein